MFSQIERQRWVRSVSLVALFIACAWNFILVFSAALGFAWVLPRVAGGQLDEMPLNLRIVYAVFSVVSIAVAWLGWRMWRDGGAVSTRIKRYSLGVIVVYSVSTVVNALSQSELERWNAVAAFVVVAATWVLRQARIVSPT